MLQVSNLYSLIKILPNDFLNKIMNKENEKYDKNLIEPEQITLDYSIE